MAFIEIEKSVREQEWSMHELHSHTHYEIFFDQGGASLLFVQRTLQGERAVVVVIPPHVMHKTEGGAFERYNVNVSADYLNPYQKDTLHAHVLQILHPDHSLNIDTAFSYFHERGPIVRVFYICIHYILTASRAYVCMLTQKRQLYKLRYNLNEQSITQR